MKLTSKIRLEVFSNARHARLVGYTTWESAEIGVLSPGWVPAIPFPNYVRYYVSVQVIQITFLSYQFGPCMLLYSPCALKGLNHYCQTWSKNRKWGERAVQHLDRNMVCFLVCKISTSVLAVSYMSSNLTRHLSVFRPLSYFCWN